METSLIAAKDASGQGSSALASKEKKFSDAAHVRVIFLLAIGRLKGLDGRHPGRLPASRTVFAGRYGEPFSLKPNVILSMREKDHA